MGERFAPVSIAVSFDGQRAVVDLGGSVGSESARVVDAMLTDLLSAGDVDLVVSLDDVDRIDGPIREMIEDISSRLAATSSRLTVRASAERLRRLDLSPLGPNVQLELDRHPITTLGTEERDDDGSFEMSDHRPAATRRVLRISSKLTDTAIDASFHRVALLAAEIVGDAQGASVTVERVGRSMTAAATNDTVSNMDRHQYDTGEGPCLAAATTGRWFHIPALQVEDRWPAFTPLAIRDGVASILSSPIMVAGRPVGALNIYSASEGAFGPRQQQLAAALAAHAAGVLADIGADDEADERTRVALRSRATIALAQGIFVERSRVTTSQALAMLLRSARDLDIDVLDLAQRVIDSSHPEKQHEPTGPAS